VLENRDYTLIIDKSGSMSAQDQAGNKSRWETVQESTLALAKKCEEFDPDGITIYVFSSRFKRYDNVTSDKVTQIFEENDPVGRTDLASVLQDALDNFFDRRTAGTTKPNGETMLVITDGEPDDRKTVMKQIIEASRKIDRDEELAISFIQVGDDPKVTEFLTALDDQLQEAGAKFDIVDTVTLKKMQGLSLSDVLLNAIMD
jgi:uncharacterized protein with von Willebrand factor type A (vWA) domain